MTNGNQLAIVIPAYKARYWDEALACLAAQTDRRFTVYVGDDAGEAGIAEGCRRFRDRLPIIYHRFPDNLGRTDLVAHWNRCVALSTEPWVWLFSDDDRCDPDAVAAFYRAREQGAESEVFRFSTTIIDGEGRVTQEPPAPPAHESSTDFALARMRDGRLSFMVEYIVARAALQREGGFISFPHAWFSDDASVIALARRSGIALIPGPHVYWRMSNDNISGQHNTALDRAKTDALFRYHEWLKSYLETIPTGEQATAQRIREARVDWYYHQLGIAGCYHRLTLTMAQTGRIARVLDTSRLRAASTLLHHWLRERVRQLRHSASRT